ncbi:PREDICTED: choline transporter-like protein 1 isoform X3 [Acromyrmex echinatior]|nr:PREDICTED: choline transporter-like protein 1 isoform X3 [Acromyrmex echinatior]XP_011067587.1 PREDICTED: choline transporter-like protein 1 isoform X3 [Acromyrmex echinatior]XP_011067667.1 PREDICTED: choline transporter-like protein 1 isoform X3 [Acromyrmex echinatior]
MGCCGCADEPSSKVEPSPKMELSSTVEPTDPTDPTTPDSHQNSPSNYSEQVFVENRSCTDFFAIIILLILAGGFVFMMTNVVKKGDIFRAINGYDNCGNVCGRVTSYENDPKFKCKGGDYTNKPYLEIDLEVTGVKKRTCKTSCEQDKTKIIFLNRCMNKKATETISSIIRTLRLESIYNDAVTDLGIAWRELIYLLLIALGLSLGILVAFRYMVQYVIYVVLIGAVLACIGGTTYLWLAWYREKKSVERGEVYPEDSSVEPYFIYAIIMSVISVIVLLVILVMRKRIELVMQLFREAGKAVYSMPALLFQPIYTYLLIGSTVIAWVYCMLWIESAGDIYLNRKNHIHFKKDALLIATRWYNLFLFFVACEFYLGCQHMVVACAVARWFFTRDKRRLSLPVAKGFGYLIRYHLGTVAFGALIIGIVRIIRAMIAFVQKYLKRYDNSCVKGILWCCQCCLWCFECVLKFLSRNAYIETAIYGCNFCTAGRKAFQALSSNILRVAAINSVGDFVLFLGKILVVTLTIVSGIYLMQVQKKEGLNHPWIPITLAGIFAFLVSHCFISIYEMIIDTIFICFCEDCEKNDGINRPYFMSRGLMEFVENSKKALKHLEQQGAATT